MNHIDGKIANAILQVLLEEIDLPESAKAKAEERYSDLGEFLSESEALSAHSPHIFPQGSFRLGTAVRPIHSEDEYDLDLACKIKEVSTQEHTQEYLKDLVGGELESYRRQRNIQEELKSKHRCWRLEYQDGIKFHMDIVPCIPVSPNQQAYIKQAIFEQPRNNEWFSDLLSRKAVYITDDRDPGYKKITEDWPESNPEGFALWFQGISDADTGRRLAAQIDQLPAQKGKSNLQEIVQLLKRHRDVWIGDSLELKPASIIITTLAARAYQDNCQDYDDLVNALIAVLNGLKKIDNNIQEILNPVDPRENFADRWKELGGEELRKTFFEWLSRARADFERLLSGKHIPDVRKIYESKFKVQITEERVRKFKAIGLLATTSAASATPTMIEPSSAPKPWGDA